MRKNMNYPEISSFQKDSDSNMAFLYNRKFNCQKFLLKPKNFEFTLFVFVPDVPANLWGYLEFLKKAEFEHIGYFDNIAIKTNTNIIELINFKRNFVAKKQFYGHNSEWFILDLEKIKRNILPLTEMITYQDFNETQLPKLKNILDFIKLSLDLTTWTHLSKF